MMKHHQNIEQEVKRTMRALDGLEPAETDPHFFARLQVRLQNDKSQSLFKSLWAEPRYALAVAAVVLIILFNLFSVAEYRQYDEEQNIQQTQEVAALAHEYKLNMLLFYGISEDTNGY